MAALLVHAAIGGGLIVEIHEGGGLLITEHSGKRQEIKLEGEAPENLLTFLEKNRGLLQPTFYTEEEVRHAREIMETGQTDITEL